MTLPSSGPISLTDIQTEFGGTDPISLSEYYKGGPYVPASSAAPNVPTSGPISLSNFYGARKLTLYTYTYTTGQSIVLPGSFTGNIIVTNMVGGGGGGGGGPDQFGSGYPGSPGRIIAGNVTGATAGSSVIIYVGGGGGGGYNAGGAGGGAGGTSALLSWSSLNLLSIPGTYRETNPNYCEFLNTYGVWNTASGSIFDQTVTINFPYSGYYSITGSCDNYGALYIDGAQVLSIDGFGGTVSNSLYVTGGNHSVRLYGVNTGGPASYGATITGGDFYGGGGGNSGPSGSSGSGGGGGGATVLLVNGVAKAVAGGGGGGGGAGQYSSGIVNNGVGGAGTQYGAGGQGNPGDGGGGGGGGGGYNGGAGGTIVGGDSGAYSGELGNSLVPLGGTQGPGSNGGAQNTAGTGGRITISYYA